MEHIRLDEPEHRETFEELNDLQQDLLGADPDDPRFLDVVPGSVDDIQSDSTQQLASVVEAGQSRDGTAQ